MNRLHKLQEHPLIWWDGVYKKKTEEKHNAVQHPSHSNQRKDKKKNKQNPHALPCAFYLEVEVNYLMVP